MKKLFIFTFLISSVLYAQSGLEYRRFLNLNGNQIQTVITNYGVLGQPFDEGPKGAWQYPANEYFSDMSLMLGIELPIKDYTGDGIEDTIHSTIITPVERPGGGESYGWNFEPVEGYFNPDANGFAISDDPNTWPELWPDYPEWGTEVWYGLNGPNDFTGDLEAFYVIDDENDEEKFIQYGFLPDSTNPDIKGHGIKIYVRYIQFNEPGFDDVLFKIYDIKNESIHHYEKMIFGNLTGSYVGGVDPEWIDDATLFYPKDDFSFTYDFDNYINNPDWIGEPGGFSEAIINSPGNIKINSFEYFVPADDITMSNDEQLWDRITPGFYDFPLSIFWNNDSIPHAIRGEDGDYLFGSGYFDLEAGETKRFVSVLTYGYKRFENFEKIKLSEILYNLNFEISEINNQINLTSLNSYEVLSGNENITWNSQNSGGSVEIWFSPDYGETWKSVERNYPDAGNYNLNTELLEDCSFGLLRIYIKNNEGGLYGLSTSHYFAINNAGNGKPFVKVFNEEFENNGEVTDNEIELEYFAGDPENDPLQLNVYYRILPDTNYFFSQTIDVNPGTNLQYKILNLNLIPDGERLKLKFEINDGFNYYSSYTGVFSKETEKPVISQTNYNFTGYTDAVVEVRIADSTQIKDHNYIISFKGKEAGEKTFSVYDNTAGSFKIQNAFLPSIGETQIFDGLTIYVEDFTTQLNEELSGWNNSETNNLEVSLDAPTINQIEFYPKPFDYIFAFSDSYNDSSNYLNQLFGSNAPPANYNINFKIYEKRKEQVGRIQFAFVDHYLPFRKDTLSFGDIIVFSNAEGTNLSWRSTFIGNEDSFVPGGGDTLFIITRKGLSKYDTLRVFDLPASIKNENSIPDKFTLYQNYPNPFNPATTIQFTIPEREIVELKLYDILGQEVVTLINEVKNEGTHNFIFDLNEINKTLASGVYIYQMKAGKFVSAKKMLLLK